MKRGARRLGRWAVIAGLGLAAPACNKKKVEAPDAGPAPIAKDAGPAIAPDAGPTLKGPAAGGRGPRSAAVAEAIRIADVETLKKDPRHASAAKFVEDAVRAVYGDKALRARIEKETGEPMRTPQAMALERLDVGPGPELWRVTYEAWCGNAVGGSAGYKSDHLLLSRKNAKAEHRLVASYRPGCDESGEPDVQLLDLDGDEGEEVVASYASTRLGAENHLELRLLRRTAEGFEAQPLLKESSPFQTLEVRYLPSRAGGRELHFRTFREDPAGCNFFELSVVYMLDRQKGAFVRGKESLRPVAPKTLVDEGEDVGSRCEKP